jgi:hypothetical protein
LVDAGIIINFKFSHSKKQSVPKKTTGPRKVIDSREEQ